MKSSNSKGKIFFALTTMVEFKPHHTRSGFMDFMDELKHHGITQELMHELQEGENQVSWWCEDDNEKK